MTLMKKTNTKTQKRDRIKRKIRMKISGTAEKPRLSIFRSNAHIYAQVIDDARGATVASASDAKMASGTKAERASKVGETVAKAALAAGVSAVVFDRNGFRYTGRVKLLADEARKAGLQF